uniref:EF-hand domain-containing protein n=1 Tax=Strigamia maritima TaxID=126957 RepID=T1JNI5_STRMM
MSTNVRDTRLDTSSLWSGKTAPPVATLFAQDPRNPNWTFDDAFYAFSRFGDQHGDGQSITLSKIDKWFKQAKIFNTVATITTADTAINFKLIARRNKRITQEEFYRFLDAFCRSKRMCPVDVGTRLVGCGSPESYTSSQLCRAGGYRSSSTRVHVDPQLYKHVLNTKLLEAPYLGQSA